MVDEVAENAGVKETDGYCSAAVIPAKLQCSAFPQAVTLLCGRRGVMLEYSRNIVTQVGVGRGQPSGLTTSCTRRKWWETSLRPWALVCALA
jgi:hypothetical protein